MRQRIWKAKLNFYKYIQDSADGSLAKEIFEEQKKNHFPGLVTECREISKELNILNELDDIKVNKAQFKQLVKNAIQMKNEEILKNEISKYSKLEALKNESCVRKAYLTEMTVEQARLNFRIRTMMTEFAFNFKNKKEYSDACWTCISCKRALDTFEHAKWCVAHEDLRQGKDLREDIDLVEYIAKVLARRAKK